MAGLVEEQDSRDEHRQREGLQGSDGGVPGESPTLPVYARVVLVLYGLCFAAVALAPAQWVSELVWATLFVGTVGWELVGVYREKQWRQEPLTHLYADRLMRRGVLHVPGWVFRVSWLALFSWWIVHWVVRVPW